VGGVAWHQYLAGNIGSVRINNNNIVHTSYVIQFAATDDRSLNKSPELHVQRATLDGIFLPNRLKGYLLIFLGRMYLPL
jgi:hypothetical protein